MIMKLSNSRSNSPLRAYQTTHPKTDVNDYPASLRVMYFQHVESLSHFNFLDRNYR